MSLFSKTENGSQFKCYSWVTRPHFHRNHHAITSKQQELSLARDFFRSKWFPSIFHSIFCYIVDTLNERNARAHIMNSCLLRSAFAPFLLGFHWKLWCRLRSVLVCDQQTMNLSHSNDTYIFNSHWRRRITETPDVCIFAWHAHASTDVNNTYQKPAKALR